MWFNNFQLQFKLWNNINVTAESILDPTNTLLSSSFAGSIRKVRSAPSHVCCGNTFKRIKTAVNDLALAVCCAKKFPDSNPPVVQQQSCTLQANVGAVTKVMNVLIGSDTAGSPYSEFLSPAEINSTVKAFSEQLQNDSALAATHVLMKQATPPTQLPNAGDLLNSLKSLGNNSPTRIQEIARSALADFVENIPNRFFHLGRSDQPFTFRQFTRNLGHSALVLLSVLDEKPEDPKLTSTRTDLNTEQLTKLSRLLAAYVKTVPKNTTQRIDAQRFALHIQGKIERINAIRNQNLREGRCSDLDVMRAVVKHNGFCLRFACKALRNRYDLVMAAVQQHGFALKYASSELRNNSDIVMAAIQNNGLALEHASSALKNNPDVVMAAVRKDGFYLFFAGNDVLNNIHVVSAAVRNYGPALVFASRDLRENRDVVRVAVQNNGLVLRYLSKQIRSDPSVVMAAVRQNGLALRYASRELQNDLGIVIAAVKQDTRALQYASESLQNIRV